MNTATETTREPLLTGPFLRMWAFSFITFLSAFQLFPTIPFRIIALGGSKAEAGLFLGLYTYAAAFSAPLTGSIADHIGRRRVLMLSAAAFVVFSLLYGIVTVRPLLLVVGLIHGVLWSAVMTSGGGIIADIIPASRRTEGIAYWGMASNAAVAVAPLVGLTLYKLSWHVLCGTMALLSCVMIVLAHNVQGGESRSISPFPRLSQIVDRRVFLAALSLAAVSFGYGGVTSYVALLATERHIDPPSLFFTLFAVTILASRIFLGPHADRIGPKLLLYPSSISMAVALVVLAFASSRLEIVISAVLYGAGMGIAFPTFVGFVLTRSDPARRAAVYGSVIMAFDAGIGTGSTVLGTLIERYDFKASFLAAAVISLISIAIFHFASRLLVPRDA